MTIVPTPPTADTVQPVVPPQDSPKRTVAIWDIILTVILLVIGLGIALIGSFLGFMLVFLSDSCGASTTCDTNQIGLGFTIATIGVWPPIILAVLLSIVVLVLRRRAFWIPLVAIVLMAAIWGVGLAVTLGAISPTPPM
jgi:hypothetical protein